MTVRTACLAFFAVAASLVACSNSSSSGSGGNPSTFVGTWSCNGTSTYNPPLAPPSSATTSLIVTANPDGTITTTTAGPDGGTADGSCPFKWSLSGSTATAISGQSCTLAPGLSGTLTSGTFVVSGATATENGSFAMTGTGPAPDGGTVTISGTLTYSATCTKP